MALPAVGAGLTTLGRGVVAGVKKYTPQAIEIAREYMDRAGVKTSVETALNSRDTNRIGVVVRGLVKGGVRLSDLSEIVSQLSESETAEIKAVIDGLRNSEYNEVDRTAIRITTGRPEIDAAIAERQIEFACNRLGMSSNQLAEIITIFHTIGPKDIETYQATRAAAGKRAL